MDSDIEKIPLLTEPAEDCLNPRQQLDYQTEREDCLSWLLAVGKTPNKGEGYALGTVKPRSYRMDQFYRWVWSQEEGYTVAISPKHADEWSQYLARTDYSSTHKTNCQKALKMLFKWRHYEKGGSLWDPEIQFTEDSSSQPRDYLTRGEREQIRNAALEYGSVPSYSNVSPPERGRWNEYLAQRFEIPKSEVTAEHWDRANGWKVPSLVWTSLDAGLRPDEVSRAVTSWVDTENCVLRIPKEDSSKSRENWIIGMKDRTATILENWLGQRENYDEYENMDQIWLTREANPYSSSSLKYILERLCDIADIETDNRQMSWYAIRHSVGTYMTREEDLAAAQAQLRHKSPQSTMKYDQTPVEDRRDALDRMG